MDRRKVLLVIAVVVAALGAGLVFVYAQGAEDRAADKLDTVQVIVATQEIAAGESAAEAAKAGKLLSKPVPSTDVIDGSTNDGNVFSGEVALTTIYPGEQLVEQKFGTADQVEGAQLLVYPEGQIAVQVQLTDYGKVGAFTQPGSHVVIFVAGLAGSAASDPSDVPLAKVLLPDVLVLGVGSGTTQVSTTVDETGQPVEETPLTNLTVAIDQDEAEQLIGAADDDSLTLWFGLRNEASQITDPSKGGKSGTGRG